MKRMLFCFICMVWIGFSCGSYGSLLDTDARIKNVQIGMTMKEVAKVMGNYYEVVKANRDITVWGYKTFQTDVYELIFEEGKLIEFNKIPLPKYVEVHPESVSE